jgi:hypothetical protein
MRAKRSWLEFEAQMQLVVLAAHGAKPAHKHLDGNPVFIVTVGPKKVNVIRMNRLIDLQSSGGRYGMDGNCANSMGRNAVVAAGRNRGIVCIA